MTKTKTQFACTECGGSQSKWRGRCSDCGAWNSLIEMVATSSKASAADPLNGYAGVEESTVTTLSEVKTGKHLRFATGLSELDRVLGGGLVQGAVVLIGGDPGIGKSTLLLQSVASPEFANNALYVTGEESLQQVSLRAKRLGFGKANLHLLCETRVENVIFQAQKLQPQVLVIDSVQTMMTETITSAPGSVSQVREAAAQLVRYAKRTGTAIYLVGHVTKEGALAGPRVLEHMVDVVLYFEGQRDSRYRVIRAMKNRFGAVNELGIFGMTEQGLRGVNNPSAIFLSRCESPSAGSVVLVSWEGSRPLLIEVQALVDESALANPRRVTVGLEGNRLAMLLAVLHRHGGVMAHHLDVFINVVGGLRITETGADLSVLSAVVSSLKNQPLDKNLAIFGEVGLGGEIRPVQGGQERIKEASKHGFQKMIVPKANAPRVVPSGVEMIVVQTLQEMLGALV